ncbi:MAG: FAD-binding oxidoreductase [Actinomycetota bacterium]
MDLIHPHAKHDVVEALREASARRERLLIVGGRTQMDRGNPCEVDGELWTTMLDEVASYDPAEMLGVVEAGIRVGDLQSMLAERGQEWPVDVPYEATVGGVIASGASSFRRLRVGNVRDTVVEMELVTGDGRLITSGARTVKNVTGFDLHRLATGSLGTLGVIVQVALKLRPLPELRRRLTVEAEGLELGRRLLDTIPLPAAVVAEPARVAVWLEGWRDEVEEQTAAARTVTSSLEIDDHTAPFDPLALDRPVVVEAAVTPSRIADVIAGRDGWIALLGVGLVWFGLDGDGDELRTLRARVAEAGGVAPAIKGPGGLGDAALPAADVHRRLKGSFDPAGILAPGRFWGDI